MHGKNIRLHNCPNEDEVKRAIEQSVEGCSVEFCNSREQLLAFEMVAATDVVVCFIDPSDVKFSDTVLWELLDRYPYLTVVVVGGPQQDRIRPHTFGGVFHLPPYASRLLIAFEVDRALQASWWWGLRESEEPFLVVDENLRIARANDAALASFGEHLVGEPYRSAIEGSGSSEIPFTHPVAEVLRTGTAASRYHRHAVRGQPARWGHLICRPIPGLIPSNVRGVGLLFVEVNRWASILEAASVFHEMTTEADLCNAIVKHAQLLGFKRARLYQFSERNGTLCGRACVGLSSENETWFRDEFRFSIQQDRPSQATLAPGRELPILFIKKPDGAAQDELTEVDSNLVQHGRPGAEQELEMGDVSRWIEAPLLLATHREGDGKTQPVKRRWGKLCVDCGDESDDLNTGDAADVALFASAAAWAIAAVNRMELDRRHIRLLRHYSERLANADWRRPEEEILPHVIDLLLEMYLEITEADVVFYRELQGNDVLQLRRKPQWRAPKPENGDVPQQKRRGEGTSSTILGGPPYQWGFKNNAREDAEDLLAHSKPERWTKQERQFIARIGSEIYLPVVVHGNLRGVIVAIAWNEGAFSSRLELCIERFMHTAGLWFELGELHDGRGWSASILGRLVPYLPRLAEARNDEAFFAALAAMLTAHDGLAWNRALMFRCEGGDPVAAELVYALGGCGEETHRDVQLDAENIPLEQLVQKRLDDPIPGDDTDEGGERLDSLYEMCVETPRKEEKPILISFGEGTRDKRFLEFLDEHDLLIGDAGDLEIHPLRAILERDYSGVAEVETPVPMQSAPWFDYMDRDYPGMFCATESYAFPLWRTHEKVEKPLGVVILEILENRVRPVEQIIPSTTIFLDLISDILAFRHHERFVRGWVGGLPAFRHHAGLSGAWPPFRSELNTLLKKLEDLVPQLGDGGQELLTRGNVLKTDRDQLGLEIAQVVRAQSAMEAAVSQPIEGLGHFLDRLADRWENQWQVRVRRDWMAVQGLGLQCPPDILSETLQGLVLNALSASRQAHQAELEIRIEARREPTESPSFFGVVALWVTDTGPGILTDVAGHIFLDGFTTDPGADSEDNTGRHKGRGLSIARAQLLMYHGDLQLVHPGPREDPLDPKKTVGATFVVRFGIPVKRAAVISPTTGDSDNGQVAGG
jgi:signal transduction histidine kinase